MKVLVTGGTGFIGSKLVHELCSSGYYVKVFTRKKCTSRAVGSGYVEFLQADLLDEKLSLDTLVSDCSHIFNCAGELYNSDRMARLHIDATQRLIDACKREAIISGRAIHWVQLSSVGAYGPSTDSRVVTEETIPAPVGDYEVSKTLADELVMGKAEQGYFSYSILRPSNVYGAEMPNNSLRQWAYLIKKNLFFFVGKPGAISTYIHVNDVVSALLLCGFDNRARGHIFNLSNDCTQEKLVTAMANTLNVNPPWLRLPEWLVRMVVKVFSRVEGFPVTTSRINALVARTSYPAAKLKEVLGYEPKYEVESTIGEVISGLDGN